MAVAALLLDFGLSDGSHPVGAADFLLIVAGNAGVALFIVLRERVLLGLLVEDLREGLLLFLNRLRALVAGGIQAEILHERFMRGKVELDGRVGVHRGFGCKGRADGTGEKRKHEASSRGEVI